MVAIPLPELKKKANRVFEDDQLPAELRWVDQLTPKHLRLFAVELSEAVKTDDQKTILAVFEAWKATAAVDADPKLRTRILAGRDQKKTYQVWQPTRNRNKTTA